jgi:hypothetical protein
MGSANGDECGLRSSDAIFATISILCSLISARALFTSQGWIQVIENSASRWRVALGQKQTVRIQIPGGIGKLTTTEQLKEAE